MPKDLLKRSRRKDSQRSKLGLRLWDGSKESSKGILKVPEGVEALPFQAGQKVWPKKKRPKFTKSLYL